MPKSNKLQLKIKRLSPYAVLPKAQTEGSVGLDLVCPENVYVYPNNSAKAIGLGFALELPKGYYGQIVLRSSTGKNTKLRLANQVSIIDTDYRGQVFLYVENLGSTTEIIRAGERIAQLIIAPVFETDVVEVDTLSETARGTKGTGSTGK